jgi:ankyrin repeat protein
MTQKTNTSISIGTQQLLEAASNGDYEKTKELLEQGIDPNIPVSLQRGQHTYDLYPLLYAIKNGHIAVAKLLIEFGANVNIATKTDGETPLHRAFMVTTERKPLGETFIIYSQPHYELIQYLVEHGADVNAEGGFCLTPLLQAVSTKSVEIAEYLLNNGADVNLQLACVDENESRDTALGEAVLKNDSDMVKLLLRYKAQPTQETLEEAVEIGNQDIINILINKKTPSN